MRSRKTLILTLPMIVAVAAALSGCGAVSEIAATVQGKTSVMSLTVGDCTNDEGSGNGEVTDVPNVPCDEPHDNEVFALIDLEADTFPGSEAVAEEADSSCIGYFETWVGSPYEETSIDIATLSPTAESWADGDREVICLAYDLEGPATGSLEGKGPEHPYEG